MLDYSRLAVTVNLGTRDVDPMVQFEAGCIVGLNSEGKITVAGGDIKPIGVAKWNKTFDWNTAVVIDEEVVLNGVDWVNLRKAVLISDSVKVTNVDRTTVYVEGMDYEVNYTNGQVRRVGTGSIPDGATVLVSYRYQMSNEELVAMRGKNYVNTTDDTLGSGKITVIENWAELYTDQYDTSKVYKPGDQLYVGDGGMFTTENTGMPYGVVYKAPTAGDPMLGVILK